jgi:dihydroorotase
VKLKRINKILLKGGTVIDPAKKQEEVLDIYIEAGKVKFIAAGLKIDGATEFPVPGKYIAPGFLDLHTHLREPGREDEETIASGSYAALRGGFTGILCMPNTEPPIDNEGVVKYILRRAEEAGFARVFPVAAVTKGRKGEEISEIGALVSAGAVALSDDGSPVANSMVMRRALEYSKMFSIPVIDHCEDRDLSLDGVMNEGFVSTKLGLRGMPDIAETVIVYRDIFLAQFTGGRVHIAHLSTRGSVEAVRWAKKQGIAVTAETCPHYFTLTDEDCQTFDPNFRVNPPLRTKVDVAAIREGLADGTIDCIATDHAPHTLAEKEVEFELAPTGIIGLESAFSLGWSELVCKKILSPVGYIKKLTTNPAKVVGLNFGAVEEGEEANFVIFDPNATWLFKPETICSKSKNSPFVGRELKSRIITVIMEDRVFEF